MSQTILVVISDPMEREEISLSLTKEGFEVIAAEDGFSGLEKVEGSHPAVFLMDVGLQGLNGLEISQLLREKPQYSKTPIFLCSDKDNPLILEAERLAVANRIFSKPIDQSLLLSSIREQLGIQEPQKESSLGLSKTPEDDSVRIEELLGWESSSDREAQTSSESGSSLPPVFSGTQDNPSPPVQDTVENVWEGKGIESLIHLEPEPSPLPVAAEAGDTGSIPTGTPQGFPSVSQEMVEKMAREIIEKVVWEVVPRLAETEVKKEIERLKKGE